MSTTKESLQLFLRENLPLYEFMELEVTRNSGELYQCRVPLTAANSNHFNTVHAALQWAACEVLGGLVFFSVFPDSPELLAVVKRFSIAFKRPAMSDLVAETRFSAGQAAALVEAVDREGRCDFELESQLRGLSGDLVATAQGIYSVRKAVSFSG